MTSDTPPRKWAILIGIDKYRYDGAEDKLERQIIAGKTKTAPKNLGGCVNDVLAMKEHLCETMQVDAANIQMLLAPETTNKYGFELPSEGQYTSPTYENIVRALADTSRYRKGDLLYIHYSGHGAQASTVFLKYKDKDARDHCLVPCDVAYGEGKYLRDVELGALLQDIVKRDVVLTVVLDCCHSGAAIRGDEDEDEDDNSTTTTIRGVSRVYQSVPGVDTHLHPLSEESISRRGNQAHWMQRPDGFAVLTACHHHQKAYETLVGREVLYQQGFLTFALLDALRSIPSPLSSSSQSLPELSRNCGADTIYHAVRATIAIDQPNQTPYMFNRDCRFFFDPEYRARVYAVPVRSANSKNIILDGGHLHGVHSGAEYVILPLGSPLDQPVAETEVLARVQVKSVTTSTANTKVISDMSDSIKRIKPGCPAVLQKLPEEARYHVRFDTTDDALRCRFVDAWESSNFKLLDLLNHVPEKDVPAADNNHAVIAGKILHFIVHINDEGLLQVTDSLELITPAVAKTLDALPWNDSESMARLVKRLEHLSRFHMARELRNYNDTAALASDVIVDIQPAPKEIYDDRCDMMFYPPESMDPLPSGAYAVSERQLFRITVTNNSRKLIGFTILDIDDQFSVSFLSNQVEPYRTLEHGGSWHQDVCLMIPECLRVLLSNSAQPHKELLKVVVTQPARDVSSLRLESLLDTEKRTQGNDRRGEEDMNMALDQLDQLLDALEKDTRMVYTPKNGRNEWVTKDLVFYVLPDASSEAK